jgi:ribosomal protein S18 acetylase RimI-like enzyme
MRIEVATSVTPELVEAFARLVPQLSRSNPPPTADQVEAMVASDCVDQFVAYDDAGAIVGVATLVVFRIPTAWRAWIEDVVVDEAVNGQGIGSALTRTMVDRARERGCTTVDLTSRPSREAANHMYKKLGFAERETTVYRYELDA